MIKRLYFIFQANIIVALLSLLVTVLSAKYLGANGRGFLALFMSYIAIVQLFSDILGGGIVLYLLRRFRVNEILVVSYFWFLIVSISAYFLLDVFDFVDRKIIFLFVVTVFFSSTSLSQSRIVLNKINLKWYNFLLVLQPAILLMFLILKGLEQMTIRSYIMTQLVSYLIISLISLFILKKQLIRKFRVKHFPRLIRNAFELGIRNQIATGLQIVNYRSAYFFLERFSTLSNVGVFSIVMSVCNALWLFATGAGILSGNQIASKGINKIIITEVNSYLRWSVLGTLVLGLIFCLIPTQLIQVILNKDFTNLKGLVILLIPGIVIFSSAKVLGYYFSATGNTKVNLKGSFFGIFPSLIMGFWLIKLYGLEGAVISLSSSLIITAAILFFHFRAESKNYLNK